MRVGGIVLVAGLVATACSPSQPEAASETTTSQQDVAVEAATSLSSPTTTVPETSSTTTTPAPTTTTTLTESTTSTSTTTPATTPTAAPTTVPAPTSTTLTPPSGNHPPKVTITSPGNLSSHVAAYDPDSLAFRAVVSMSAKATDPDGDPVAVDWYSSLSGYLGTGEFISASLTTIHDSSQPFITARATDPYGATSEATIQVIVWVPSDA